MASRPTVRVKVSPKFPAQVVAGDGITIEQSGGVYTFSAPGTMAGPPAHRSIAAVAVFDGDTGQLLDDTTGDDQRGRDAVDQSDGSQFAQGLLITQTSPTTASYRASLTSTRSRSRARRHRREPVDEAPSRIRLRPV